GACCQQRAGRTRAGPRQKQRRRSQRARIQRDGSRRHAYQRRHYEAHTASTGSNETRRESSDSIETNSNRGDRIRSETMSDIVTERSDSVLRVQLNRPASKNAMTSAMYIVLADAFNAAAKDDQIRVVLWHGAG